MSQYKTKKHINDIVVEEINKFFFKNMVNESFFNEEEDSEKKKKKDSKKKKKKDSKEKEESSKMSASQRKAKERIAKAAKRDGKEVGNNVAKNVRDFLNDPTVNVSEVMVQATGLEPTSASSLGAKIAKGDRPVKQKLAQVVHNIQNQIG